MDFRNNELTEQVAQSAKDFAIQHIKPHLMEWDESQEFPVHIFKELGKLGMMGVLVPEAYGGTGLGYYEYSAIIQEISKVCGSIGLSVAAHNSLCTGHILAFGNEEQKQKYLPKLATAEFIGAWGLTEPNTGSDAGNMKTTAVKDGNNWIINGAKSWITHGKSGDVAVLIARTGEPRAKNNCTAFIIDRGTAGFTAGKKENKPQSSSRVRDPILKNWTLAVVSKARTRSSTHDTILKPPLPVLEVVSVGPVRRR